MGINILPWCSSPQEGAARQKGASSSQTPLPGSKPEQQVTEDGRQMLHLTPPRKIVLPLGAGEEDAWGAVGVGVGVLSLCTRKEEVRVSLV